MHRRHFLLASAAPALAAWEPGPAAETRYGSVRGATTAGVHVFRGIPYGAPTEGAARFLAPAAPAKWTGIRDAVETGPRCVQGPGNIFLSPTIGEYFGGGRPDRVELSRQSDSENCLVLNVLTRALRGKRPVMVYIHGGGFTGGSSLLTLYSDAFVREQDVVLVGVNHRINVFGYLYLAGLSKDFPDSGNVGQLDLIAALGWVRDNIANFGGDPHNVTIFGESGGGAKISALMAMPAAKGLFHKAIVESGSQLKVRTPEEATTAAIDVLEKAGLSHQDPDKLRDIPAARLYEAAGRGYRAGPVVDGRSIPSQTWEPDASAISANIPMIIGTCKDESTLFSLQDADLFRLDQAALRRRIIADGIPEAKAAQLLASYREDYPADSPADTWFRLSSDRGARHLAIRQAERKLEQRKAPVYMYYFAWNTPLVDGRIKAFHTAELPLAMRLVRFPESDALSRQIAGAWAAFARRGDPNHSGMPKWTAYSAADRATMIFDTPSVLAKDPGRAQRMVISGLPSGRSL